MVNFQFLKNLKIGNPIDQRVITIDPLLSIIIPTYNSDKTLENCLKSIENQSYLKWEVIFIDRLSIDNTKRIIQEFSAKFPNATYISENDHGIYDAMNKGIQIARGEWLYFLGIDDFFYSDTVLDKIFCKSNIENDVIYGNVFSPRFGGLYGEAYTNEKLFNQNICHQAIFFRKKIFKNTGLFNLKYRYYADWDHNVKCFRSKKIKKKYINELIAFYADGGLSSKNIDDLFLIDNRWRYIKYHKNTLSLSNKLRMTKAVLKSALKGNRKGNALRILFETPYLFV